MPNRSDDTSKRLTLLNDRIVVCRLCPRLVEWRERVAHEKRASFKDESYWGKAVPNFGDMNAERLVVGLAPAAHGGNRTGRLFTGDRSGDWIFRALHKAGAASQAESTRIGDGLVLEGVYMSPAVHCAPPDNKPLPMEIENCRVYLKELLELRNWRAVLCLGQIGWNEFFRTYGEKTPKFGHLMVHRIDNGPKVVGSYHPSQQNTFTGRLTEEMLDAAVKEFLHD